MGVARTTVVAAARTTAEAAARTTAVAAAAGRDSQSSPLTRNGVLRIGST